MVLALSLSMYSRLGRLFAVLLFSLTSIAFPNARGQTFPLFATNATWRYVKGTQEASAPDPSMWRQRAFDDRAWNFGNAPFFYGETYLTPGTLLGDMQNTYTTLFLRRAFVITNAAEIAQLELTAACDDGYIAWINGVPLVNANGPAGDPLFNSTAPAAADEPPPFVSHPFVDPGAFLVTGTNVLAMQLFNVSLGSSDLVFDASLDATLKEQSDPRVWSVSPAPGTALTNLTQITVTFTKPVTGVDPADLWVADFPATGMTGAGTTYTFTFDPPPFGTVQIGWDMRHGITDLANPPRAFNATGPGATWYYDLYDPAAPTLATLNPPANATVRILRQVEVSFSKPVSGVDAADLLINGTPATNVTGVAAGPYRFEFPAIPTGLVTLAWAPQSGIVDFAPEPHAFAGGTWKYSINPQLTQPDILINEFMAENVSGITDEDGDREDWIELYNRGDQTVDLAGWSLTDDPRQPDQWVFPAVSLAPKRYLVVYASGKDRKPTAASARLHTNFKLSITGEYLGLYNTESPRVAVSEFAPQYPEQRNDVAYGRDALDTWRYFATGTPGAANSGSVLSTTVEPVHFSVPRGFFSRPFSLSLATPTPGATIRYTLDGSTPTATNGLVYTNPIPISATRVVRAAAFQAGTLPSRIDTHSYLYNVTALRRRLPSLSLVTATNNLYGKTGIMEYNPRNTYNHGIAWERPVSAEWIQPDDNGGFQVDCGLRIQGGGYIRGIYNYRSTAIPDSKYSFRLYFRGDYGPGQLHFPVFPEAPVDTFDVLSLRAGMNDATNPFLRDEFARRLEADVGCVASHGTFVQLYLNGVYKGYYNPAERIGSDFLRTWHGGTNDWDLIAMGGEIREGDSIAWTAMRTYASTNNLQLADKYLELERRLDLTNFVEYLIPLIYADTDDWPHNNWRAARERSPQGIFRFYAWDAEWSFGFNNPSSHNTIANQLSSQTPPWGGSEIQTLFLKLKASPEFRLLFADRVHKHFFNGGAMTDDRIKARYEWVKALIAPSISGYDNSIGASWIPTRRRYLTNHFALAGLLASSNAPVFNQFGGAVPRGYGLTLASGLGTIHYTTDGSDPRVRFTDAVGPTALTYSAGSPIVLDRPMLVRARTHWGTNWSAVTEAAFQINDLTVPLRISEIMYHPPGGEEYEYVELLNTGGASLDLSGVHFSGITFRFPEGTSLAPGARVVLAPDTNPAAFARRYPGVVVAGYYSGSLSNKGERLTLLDTANRVILSVNYGDGRGWPASADGGGHSLELIDALADPDDPTNWRASLDPGGSPGAANPAPTPPPVQLNEIAAALSTPPDQRLTNAWCELVNRGATEIDLTGWSFGDGTASRRFLFPSIRIAAGAYLLLYCDTNAAPPGLHTGFSLDSRADQVSLFDAAGARIDAIRFGAQAPGYTLGRTGLDLAWRLTEPTAGGPNATAAVGTADNLAVNEFLANALPGGDDWIEIYNRDTTRPVSLDGLWFAATNAIVPAAAHVFVAPHGYVLLHADEQPGPNHLNFKLPAAAGFVALLDPVGRTLDSLAYTNAVEGVSIGRIPDGAASLAAFTYSPSPGAANYLLAYDGIRINEVLVRNVSVLADARGQHPGWIELHNPTASSLSLDGLSLSFNQPHPGEWPFPAGLNLPAAAFLLIWCDANRSPSTHPEPELNAGQELPPQGGGIYLFNPTGQLVDRVEFGFQLPDLSIGRSANSWTLLSTPTPRAVNADPALRGDNLNVRFNEWMAADSSSDWIELYNLESLPVDLGGMLLTDDPSLAGQTNHVVRPLTFIPGHGHVLWHADGNPDAGPDHLAFSLDSLGETVRLYSATLTTADSVDFLVQTQGVSEGRFPDGGTNLVRFPGTASPGAANYRALESVVINEVLPAATPPREPAIELLNLTTDPVDIGGWWLSDEMGRPDKFAFPSGTIVPPHGFKVVYHFQFAPRPEDGTGFEMAAPAGGTVILSASTNGLPTGQRSIFTYGAMEPGVSFGRYPTLKGLDFPALVSTSFGNDQPADLNQFRAGTGRLNAPPRVGPVVLSEIMYDPLTCSAAGVTRHPEAEFVELHNAGNDTVDLFQRTASTTNGWHLGGALDFTFPDGTSLRPGGYLVVVNFDPQNDATALAAFRGFYHLDTTVRLYGPAQGQLANEGERLFLERPFADASTEPHVVIDVVDYLPTLPWPPGAANTGRSLQRNASTLYGNDARNWHAGWPTPGRDNQAAEPDADQDGLPDEWELIHGLNPASAVGADGAEGDSDQDGLPNRLEYAYGTDPHTKDLIVTSMRVADGFLYLDFNVVAGRSYSIEVRDTAEGGDWSLLSNFLPVSTAQILEFKYPHQVAKAARYFRVRVQ